MRIGGFIKQSLMDYPGKIASVVFTQGCNFKCPYCHNAGLIPVCKGSISNELVFSHLEKNKLLLDGVVISGGEPTMQTDLYSFVTKVKELGLLVKLDTNGTNPILLKKLIEHQLLDYIAMDVKTALSFQKYAVVSGISCTITDRMTASHPIGNLLFKLRQSIQFIIESGIEHEFRTTICKELISLEDIRSILNEITGCQRYFLQQYQMLYESKTDEHHLTPYYNDDVFQFIEEQQYHFLFEYRL